MIICKGCGKEIIKKKGRGRSPLYCSDTCRWRITKRNWYIRNRNTKKEYNKKWMANYRNNNRDIINEKRRNWYQDISTNENTKKIIRKRSFNNKPKILKIFNYMCNQCGSKENLEFHHTSYDLNLPIENISILLCKNCHNKIHTKYF